MRRTIRRGVFETNSSSMHSIVITNNDKFKNEEEREDYFYAYCHNKDGKMWVMDDELTFERTPFEVLATAKEKLLYAIANKIPTMNEHGIKASDNKALQNEVKKFDELASEIFAEHQCTGIDYPDTRYSDEPFYGYVDGQSIGLFDRFLEGEGISIKEFICNPKYVVVIDGDEYRVFDKMKEAGLIDCNNIVKEFD